MDELFDKIKDGASKAKDGASKIAKEVAKRTTNAIAITKLSFSVNEAQSKIKDIYTEIGKSLYTKHLDGNDYAEFEDELAQIDKLMTEIETLNDKIAELKNSLKCRECGALNPNTSDYCAKCGSVLPKESNDDDVEEDSVFADDSDDDEEVIIITPQKPE